MKQDVDLARQKKTQKKSRLSSAPFGVLIILIQRMKTVTKNEIVQERFFFLKKNKVNYQSSRTVLYQKRPRRLMPNGAVIAKD